MVPEAKIDWPSQALKFMHWARVYHFASLAGSSLYQYQPYQLMMYQLRRDASLNITYSITMDTMRTNGGRELKDEDFRGSGVFFG